MYEQLDLSITTIQGTEENGLYSQVIFIYIQVEVC